MKRLVQCVLAITASLVFCSPAAGQSDLPTGLDDAIKEIDALTATEYAKDKIGSVTIGVVYGSRLIWTKSYGYADMKRGIAAHRETVYRIGSVTKMFTALMLLQLEQEGKVRFSDPVEKYFPEINSVQGRVSGAPPITLIELATHTAGLPVEPNDMPRYITGPVADWEKILICALPQTRYAYEPGTGFHYSNLGYAILGAALSRAAGQRYIDYLEQKVFTPLAMSHSALEPNSRIRSAISRGYLLKDGKINTEIPEREHAGRGYKVPNGAIYTTVDDLARFVSFELGEGPTDILKRANIEASFTRGVMMESDLSAGYGLGFEVYRRGEVVIFGHGGAVAGYQAGALFDRRTKMGLVVLRNASGGAFDIAELSLKAVCLLALAGDGQPAK